ncbi:DUF2935 domain-containing protein [Acetivibrio straminisolvens]|jgi:hypothetical protein|uniref:DUF2935 domain-containing protein n=1 Tax=Acetivibrio straminisolvens JCM 21531 TaxID=1294263 RepID=W4VBV6_9FIRM|nr:DUF2935 domain-containing protein [Acetivibrio straminisolvens]GAE90676.1 hypothetical protein JCM21531_4307 [Acetivibrio straminisolvens JCM 21531]
MQFCYGDKNHIRILEEAEFWKRQEAEHTVVIRKIIPDLEDKFVEKLDEYQKILSATEATILQYIERLNRSCYVMNPELVQKIANIIEITLCQSKTFVNFLNTMAKESAAALNNLTASVVINHIVRESEYYIGIAKAYLGQISYR